MNDPSQIILQAKSNTATRIQLVTDLTRHAWYAFEASEAAELSKAPASVIQAAQRIRIAADQAARDPAVPLDPMQRALSLRFASTSTQITPEILNLDPALLPFRHLIIQEE